MTVAKYLAVARMDGVGFRLASGSVAGTLACG